MKLFVPLAVAFITLSTHARAIDVPEPGETLCYGRVYGEQHTHRNPDQQLRLVILELTRWRAAPDSLNFQLKVLLGDDEQHLWWSSGGCYEDGQRLDCAVDCDGGGFHLRDDKNGSVLLENDRDGFVVQMACGEELPESPQVTHVPVDAANAAYRLTPLPGDFCTDYE